MNQFLNYPQRADKKKNKKQVVKKQPANHALLEKIVEWFPVDFFTVWNLVFLLFDVLPGKGKQPNSHS